MKLFLLQFAVAALAVCPALGMLRSNSDPIRPSTRNDQQMQRSNSAPDLQIKSNQIKETHKDLLQPNFNPISQHGLRRLSAKELYRLSLTSRAFSEQVSPLIDEVKRKSVVPLETNVLYVSVGASSAEPDQLAPQMVRDLFAKGAKVRLIAYGTDPDAKTKIAEVMGKGLGQLRPQIEAYTSWLWESDPPPVEGAKTQQELVKILDNFMTSEEEEKKPSFSPLVVIGWFTNRNFIFEAFSPVRQDDHSVIYESLYHENLRLKPAPPPPPLLKWFNEHVELGKVFLIVGESSSDAFFNEPSNICAMNFGGGGAKLRNQ